MITISKELNTREKSYTKLEDKKNFINQFVDKITVYWDSISNTHKLVITFKLKIVKDQRIKEEKYVFKLQKGQNDKVISDINSKKYNKLIKNIKPITRIETDAGGAGSKFCTNDTCTI